MLTILRSSTMVNPQPLSSYQIKLDDTRALGVYLESSHGTISEGEPILRPPSTNLSAWRRSRKGTRQPTPPVAPLRKRHDMDAPSLNPRTLGTAAATTPLGAAAKN